MLFQQPAIKSILKGIVLWAPLWLGAMVVCGFLGGFYAFFLKEDTYLASQAILVRDEANATAMRMGRFESQTQMKAAQETILEMAKNRQVVRDALTTVGPQSTSFFSKLGLSTDKFPDDKTVDDFAIYNVSVHAPKGVEFGATEVIYLDVKAGSADYAHKLVIALSNALDTRLKQVREARATSVISELEAAKVVAKQELEKTSLRIREMETQAGAQLSDLRGLTDAIGSGAPRSQIDQIMTERRTAQAQLDQLLADQKLLEEALADPTAYVVAPGSLLNSQPGLKKLREGLADAQLNTSALRGRFTDAHPLVLAADEAQATIERRLIDSLEDSQVALMQDIETNKKRIADLDRQKQLAEERLDSLAAIRTEYSNLVSELKTRTTILEETERQLAEAHASKESAIKVSLMTLLDDAVVSDKPLGPGRLTIAAISAIGGMLLGLGFVFAVTPIDGMPRFGRRASDRMANEDASRPSQTTEDRRARNNSTNPTPAEEPRSPAELALERRMAVDLKPAAQSRTSNRSKALTEDREKQVQKYLVGEAVYEQASKDLDAAATSQSSEASAPAASSGLTILERLAKAQQEFEDGQRQSDQSQDRKTTAPYASKSDGEDRRLKPRNSEPVPTKVEVGVRRG